MNPQLDSLETKSIRRRFFTEKYPPVTEAHSLMSILLPYFLSHSSEVLFPKEHYLHSQSKSTILFKRTKNHIPLFVCNDLEKAKNWAIDYLVKNPNNAEWKFALATTGKSWELFVVRNQNKRFQKKFKISKNPKQRETYEDLLRNLLVIIGFDAKYTKSLKRYLKQEKDLEMVFVWLSIIFLSAE